MSTLVPGSRPSASRRALGNTIRPAWSMTASMGIRYHRIPISKHRPGAGGAWPSEATGITVDTMVVMAMTLRLTEAESRALRRRAEHEGRPMQEVARQAIREYVEAHSRAELLDRVLDEELPRYAEALERLGQ